MLLLLLLYMETRLKALVVLFLISPLICESNERLNCCYIGSTTVLVTGKGAHISYRLGNENPLRSSERNTLDFQFLTKATDGVFFYMGGKKDHLLVELVNGSVRAQANVGGGEFTTVCKAKKR